MVNNSFSDTDNNDKVKKSETNGASDSNKHIKTLLENIFSVINQRYAEHREYIEGWYQWANGLMMQMQTIPPQAEMDFDRQNNRLTEFVLSFKPSAEVFDKMGHPELLNLIKNTEAGARKSQEIWDRTNQAIAKDNIQSQQNIINLNKKNYGEILGMQQESHRKQVNSINKSHESFMKSVRGELY